MYQRSDKASHSHLVFALMTFRSVSATARAHLRKSTNVETLNATVLTASNALASFRRSVFDCANAALLCEKLCSRRALSLRPIDPLEEAKFLSRRATEEMTELASLQPPMPSASLPSIQSA